MKSSARSTGSVKRSSEEFTPEQWAEQFYDDKPLNNDGHFLVFDFSNNFLKISKDSELYNNGQHVLDVNITVGIRQVPVV